MTLVLPQTAPAGKRILVSVLLSGGEPGQSTIHCRCLNTAFEAHDVALITDDGVNGAMGSVTFEVVIDRPGPALFVATADGYPSASGELVVG